MFAVAALTVAVCFGLWQLARALFPALQGPSLAADPAPQALPAGSNPGDAVPEPTLPEPTPALPDEEPQSAPGVWGRPHWVPTSATARYVFFCVADEPPPEDAQPDLQAHGFPAVALPEGVVMGTVLRDEHPDFWVSGPPADPALDPALAARIQAARCYHYVTAELPDPSDLAHLQAAWAFVRWTLNHGAFAVLDLHADRWLSADEVRDGVALDLACAWRQVTEPAAAVLAANADHHNPEAVEPRLTVGGEAPGFVVYTRGMDKFARRELIACVPEARLALTQRLLTVLAHDQMLGRLVESGVGYEHDRVRFAFRGYNPGFNAPAVDFGPGLQPLLLVELAVPEEG
jgi:hypothetical protein